ncbi:MAG TPA: hypothetical protein VEK07_24075 [Polyangiaceae bacterium]|nr:hypothetical protein [Polyangiaceae bacterium]
MKRFLRATVPLVVGGVVASCSAWTQPPGATSKQPSSACLSRGANCHTDQDCCTLTCDNNICVLPPTQ